MIGAGIVLLAIGLIDIVRTRLGGRRLAVTLVLLAGALALVAIGAGAAAWLPVAVAVSAVWLYTTSTREPSRFGLWPVILPGGVAAASVSIVGVRGDQGPLGELWPVDSPLGVVSFDLAVAIAGSIAFLFESGNIIVRAALRDGAVVAVEGQTLKGGRLIGPLERILVFALTLTGAFTLLAAVLAAKGIVRFPEISRDDVGGNRAEYFLVGSLVSWVTALGAAFLIWWGGVG